MSANDALAAQFNTLGRSARLNKHIAGELTAVSNENFPKRTVAVWQGENGFLLATGGALIGSHPAPMPDFIKGNFSGFFIDRDTCNYAR